MADHAPHHDDEAFSIVDRIDHLDDPRQFRYLSGEELRTFLDPGDRWVVADLGSGTGFFTDELALAVETCYAVDVHEEMHAAYRAKGLPDNVVPVTADVADLPLPDDALDAVTSIRSFHHGVVDALDEVVRVLRPSGRIVVVDWSATGAGERERGKHPEHYFTVAEVQARLIEAGFRIRAASERRETFVVVASLGPVP